MLAEALTPNATVNTPLDLVLCRCCPERHILMTRRPVHFIVHDEAPALSMHSNAPLDLVLCRCCPERHTRCRFSRHSHGPCVVVGCLCGVWGKSGESVSAAASAAIAMALV